MNFYFPHTTCPYNKYIQKKISFLQEQPVSLAKSYFKNYFTPSNLLDISTFLLEAKKDQSSTKDLKNKLLVVPVSIDLEKNTLMDFKLS